MTPMIDVIFQLLIFFMLTMKFTTLEGKLLSQLPLTKGTADHSAVTVDELEVRIFLCAEGEAGIRRHREDKGRHDVAANKALNAARTYLYVEGRCIGIATRGAENAALYATAAGEAAALRAGDTTVKIDSDGEVPYEHVLGVLNALKRRDVTKIEFVASPRLATR